MKHAQQYFRKYKHATILYFTADDLAFTDKDMALQHAGTLDDDMLIGISRSEASAAFKDMTVDGSSACDMEDEPWLE